MEADQRGNETGTAPLPRAALAVIGVAMLTRDILEDNFNRMVQRGELIQAAVDDSIREIRGQFRLQGQATDVKTQGNGHSDSLAQRLGIPSRHDVHVLQTRLTELLNEVEQLGMGRPNRRR